MLLKWIYFVVLLHITSTLSSKHSFDVDFEDLSDSVENMKTTPCDGETCLLTSTKNLNELLSKTQDPQPNVFDLLLTLLTKTKNQGETNISINVRDIQSGFQNGGSKYHVGNVHRELNRDKRDVEFVSNDVTTPSNSLNEVGALELSPKDSKVDIEYLSSKDSITIATTEDTSNNDGTVEATVRSTEENNFQDSNVTDIFVPVANDTASSSVNVSENNIFNYLNSLDLQVTSMNVSDNLINSLIDKVLQDVDTNVTASIPASSNIVQDVSKLEVSNDTNNLDQLNTESISQMQPSEVKNPLSQKVINSIQNVLNDNLGVGSKGANSVANFSVNFNASNKNPVLVLVYNCSCRSNDSNHIHTISTEDEVNNYNDKDDDNFEVLGISPKFTINEQTVITTEDDNTEKSVNVINKKTSNAELENEILQKCNSLLSLQLKNKGNIVSETELDNLRPLSLINNAILDKLTVSRGNEKDLRDVQSLIANLNLGAMDPAVSLVNENLNTAIGTQTDNSETVFVVIEENRKKRRIDETNTMIENINTLSRRKRGLSDIINEIFKFLMIVPSDVPNDSTEVDSHEVSNGDSKFDTQKTVNENEDTKSNTQKVSSANYKHETETAGVLDDEHRHRRSMQNVINYIRNHYVITPKENKDGAIRSKREVEITRSPKYYDYINDKPSLLESNPNSKENDGVVVNFKSVIENKNGDDEINSSEDNDKDYNSLQDVTIIKDELMSFNDADISKDVRNLLSNLNLKPIFINVYLQFLMKD